MEDLYYINSKDKKVDVKLSNHAKCRFKERYNRVHITDPLQTEEEFEEIIRKLWFVAVPKINKSKKLLERSDKHGKDTLYFVSNYFTFVVQNSTIVTIELSSRDTKHLNKKFVYKKTKERNY